jgi:WD40 repeat protein
MSVNLERVSQLLGESKESKYIHIFLIISFFFFFQGHVGAVWCVAWHPRSRSLLASCGADKSVNLWTDEANDSRFSLSSTLDDMHSRTVRRVAWSSDGTRLAAARQAQHTTELVAFVLTMILFFFFFFPASMLLVPFGCRKIRTTRRHLSSASRRSKATRTKSKASLFTLPVRLLPRVVVTRLFGSGNVRTKNQFRISTSH